MLFTNISLYLVSVSDFQASSILEGSSLLFSVQTTLPSAPKISWVYLLTIEILQVNAIGLYLLPD